MKAVCAVALLAGSACAFVPSSFSGSALQAAVARPATMSMSVDAMLGADVEVGGVFDPAGFSKDESKLAKYRAVELKHGRISMLACLGMWVQSAGIHMPDPVFSESKPIDAFFKVLSERPAAAIQVLLAITWLETVASKGDVGKEPGDVGNFGDNFKPADEADYAALQLKELKNGRLAMMGFMGMLVQEALTGQSVFGQLSSGHISPFGDGQGFF
ncbi:light harvesting complex protein [Tribonema minus]|uniref:Light harvesting complex protein n=1 Tax=Tribonema minus TaxID=303371 RepID=A0A835YR33_9STRA|nr:light harvesting complex protein [Tribonema minus]